MRTLLTALASVLLLLASSCTSPLAGLKVTSKPLPSVGPNENQLVFHFQSSAKTAYGYGMGDVGYLVVQLRSKYQQSAKFASAPVVAGTATVSFNGLVAGPWEILASCYDWDGDVTGTPYLAGSPDPTQPFLLYTGQDQLMITPGTTTPVSLLFYKPGDISVTGAPAAYVNALTLSDSQVPPQSGPTHLKIGDDLTLFSHATSGAGSTVNVEQRVYWFSSDPSVLEVANAPKNDGSDGSYAGTTSTKIYAKRQGHAYVYATSIEFPMTGIQASAMYEVWVDPPYLGMWKMTASSDNSPSIGEIYLKISRDPVTNQLVWERTKGANTGTMISKDRGNVSVNGDASITLEYKQYFDTNANVSTSGTWQNYPKPTFTVPSPINVAIGNGIYNFNEMVSGYAQSFSYTFGLMGTGGLPAYVPSTGLAVSLGSKPYTGSYVSGGDTLVATQTGPTPTIKTVLWYTTPSPSGIGNFWSGNYGHSVGTPAQYQYTLMGPIGFRAVSLDDTSIEASISPINIDAAPSLNSFIIKDPGQATSGSLPILGQVQLTAVPVYSVPGFVPQYPPTYTLAWTSSSPITATVVGTTGWVTAGDPGVTTITATYGALSVTPYTLTVTP